MENTLEGTIKWYNEEKGFGFIQNESGADIFVHVTNIVKGPLTDGARVSYTSAKSNDGRTKAENVKLL